MNKNKFLWQGTGRWMFRVPMQKVEEIVKSINDIKNVDVLVAIHINSIKKRSI